MFISVTKDKINLAFFGKHLQFKGALVFMNHRCGLLNTRALLTESVSLRLTRLLGQDDSLGTFVNPLNILSSECPKLSTMSE